MSRSSPKTKRSSKRGRRPGIPNISRRHYPVKTVSITTRSYYSGTASYVDPSAIVHPTARLGIGVIIGPKVSIGRDCRIGAYSVIGAPPEHRDFYESESDRFAGVIISDNVVISQFVTVHSGTKTPTIIMNNAALFQGCHVGHDCYLADFVTIGGKAQLAGHTVVQRFAQICGGSCTHQHVVVGAYSMLAPMSFLKGHIPPGQIWTGTPARPMGKNVVGLKRGGISYAECLREHQLKFEWCRDASKLK